MNLLKDIKKLVKNDKEHNLSIGVNNLGIKVFLDYDPNNDYEEKYVIPIVYEVSEQFAYIPDNEYKKIFNDCDYGLDLNEIELIRNIMRYLESHGSEICELCDGFAHKFRNGDD